MELEKKLICTNCIGNDYLRRQIHSENTRVECSYCGDEVNGCTILELAEVVDTAFHQHYDRSSEFPPDNWSIYELKNFEYEPDGEPIIDAIAEAVEVSQEVAIDIQSILKDKHYDRSADEIHEYSEYHDESFYEFKGQTDDEWQQGWEKFEEGLKSRARFFSKEAEEHLRHVFDGVEIMKTHENRPVVRKIGLGTDLTHLYRARVFQSLEKLKKALKLPDIELGPPPSEYASAGRMNARGISAFYGATSLETAVAEVRPPVGSNVVVANFQILRELKMLDLTALNFTTSDGSIFDPTYANRISKAMFLRKLSSRITKPVMPDDEHFEYLSTQAIADFLSSELEFDGIIFPSAQSPDGVNVVLFNKSSKVQEISYPKGTRIEIETSEWDEDIEVPAYSVTKWIPDQLAEKDARDKDMAYELFGFQHTDNKVERPDTLSINVGQVSVEHILPTKINRSSFQVWDRSYPTSKDMYRNLSDD